MAKLARVRALPWLMLYEVGRATYAHLAEVLSPSERGRVVEIVKRSKGNPRAITDRDRRELKRIAAKLEITRLGREVLPAVARGRGAKKRR